MRTWFIFIGIVPLLTGLYFFDNIRGYYRFEELCQQEKRLVINTKLEKDAGWQISSNTPLAKEVSFLVAGLPNIKFVRFRDRKSHDWFDVYYIGQSPRVADGGWAASRLDKREVFEVRPANWEVPVVYEWEEFSEALPTETRMFRSGYRFTDLRNKKVVFSFTELGYSTFDRNHTLFDAPSGNLCGNIGQIWENEIQSQIF